MHNEAVLSLAGAALAAHPVWMPRSWLQRCLASASAPKQCKSRVLGTPSPVEAAPVEFYVHSAGSRACYSWWVPLPHLQLRRLPMLAKQHRKTNRRRFNNAHCQKVCCASQRLLGPAQGGGTKAAVNDHDCPARMRCLLNRHGSTLR
jgi:hypothetical protein